MVVEAFSLQKVVEMLEEVVVGWCWLGFPGDSGVKNLPANAGDMGRSHMPLSGSAHEPQLLSQRSGV